MTPPIRMVSVPLDVATEAVNCMARAYERVHSLPRVSDTELANRVGVAKEALRIVLAAAPVREEGVSAAIIRALLDHVDRDTCQHDNLKRGGVQWTICEDCGRKWADDQGGFKPYVDPQPVAAARLYLSAFSTREEAPAEAGALPEAMRRLAEDAENEAGLGAGMLGGARIAADIRTVLSALRAQPQARSGEGQ